MKKILLALILIFTLISCGEVKNIQLNKDKVLKTKLNNSEIKKDKLEEELIDDKQKKEEINKENEIKKIDYSLNEGTKIISKYYSLLSEGNFKEAYNLKYKPTISLKKFIQNYTKEGEAYIILSSIKKEGLNRFKFKVGMFYKKVYLEENFEVVQEITEGKLKLIYIKKIVNKIKYDKEIVKYGNKKAYIEFNNGEYNIILEEKGKKKIIGKSGFKYGTYLKEGEFNYLSNYLTGSPSDLKFIGNGNILKYNIRRWESGDEFFYIINSKKLINSNGIILLYGITTDKKYFYMCGVDGMGGSNEFNIYDMKTGKIVKKLTNGINEMGNCSEYNKKGNFLVFDKYSGSIKDSKQYKKYKYYFNTNTLEEIIK